jgi:DNA-binding transcriptional regulator GbsR (MarR family)
MRGYTREEGTTGVGTLSAWEALVVDAVGNVIDFWKFKRNQGRVWAILFLRGVPMSALELQTTLGLSKGAVSMLVRELEQWGVIARTRNVGDDSWHFIAVTDLPRLVGRVFAERELELVKSVREDLERAEKMARDAGTSRIVLQRLRRMRRLAELVEYALKTFVSTMRLDVVGAFESLSGTGSDRS